MKLHDSSFGTSDEEEDFNWGRFIHEEGGSAAPSEAFYQPKDVPVNNFRVGHIIMARDPKVKTDGAFLAQVEKVYKCFIRIRIIELTRNRFWTMCDNDRIYPFSETQLRRHPDNPKTDKAWEKWLMKFMETNSNQIAPHNIIQPIRHYPARNFFQRGMVLAFMDSITFTGKFSPAIVTEVKNSQQICLRLADRGSRTDILVGYDDRRLFPIEFAKEAGIPVRCPKIKKATKSPKILTVPRAARKEMKPKKKPGRPKGSKSKKTLIAQRKIATPSWSNSDCPADVNCGITFHPQRASTPLDLDTSVECLDTSYFNTTYNNDANASMRSMSMYSLRSCPDTGNNANFNTHLNTTPPLNILKRGKAEDDMTFITPAGPIPMPESKLNRTTPSIASSLNLSTFNFVPKPSIITPGKSTESNSGAIERLNIQSPNLHTNFFSPTVKLPAPTPVEMDSLADFQNFKECWLQAGSPAMDADKSPQPLTISMRNCFFTTSCRAVWNNNAFAGPYIRTEILVPELAGLPTLHYKMQYYNILVALAKSTAAPVAVLDIMRPDSLTLPNNLTVYVESNNVIHSKKMPAPTDLKNANEWLRYFLKRLHADDDLVKLEQIQ